MDKVSIFKSNLSPDLSIRALNALGSHTDSHQLLLGPLPIPSA